MAQDIFDTLDTTNAPAQSGDDIFDQIAQQGTIGPQSRGTRFKQAIEGLAPNLLSGEEDYQGKPKGFIPWMLSVPPPVSLPRPTDSNAQAGVAQAFLGPASILMPKSVRAKVGAGMANLAEGGLEGLESGPMLMSGGLAGADALLAKLVSGGFFATLAPDAAQKLYQGIKDKDPQAMTEGAGLLAMAGGAGLHAISPVQAPASAGVSEPPSLPKTPLQPAVATPPPLPAISELVEPYPEGALPMTGLNPVAIPPKPVPPPEPPAPPAPVAPAAPKVTSSAIRDRDTGEIWSGKPTHGLLHDQIPNMKERNLEPGFMTDSGKFLTQEESETLFGMSSGEEFFVMTPKERSAFKKMQQELEASGKRMAIPGSTQPKPIPALPETKLGIWPESEWNLDNLKKQTVKQRQDKARFLGLRSKEGLPETGFKKLADAAQKRISDLKAPKPAPEPEPVAETKPPEPATVSPVPVEPVPETPPAPPPLPPETRAERYQRERAKRGPAKNLAPTPPPLPSTAEPAAAKVEAQVSKVAATEGKRSAEDIKDELINELQKKLMKAPGEGTVTVDIPGDGVFTVKNTVEAISTVLDKVRKLKTDSGKPPGVPKKAIQNSEKAIRETAGQNAEIAKAQAELDAREKPTPPGLAAGPGAKTAGEGDYPAIQLLTDQLKATPATGTPESVAAREKIADAWSKGKTGWEKTMAHMRAATETLKDIGRGVRSITGLDERVGTLDYALQKSALLSRDAKRAIIRQVRNKTERDAVAIYIDAGGDIARIKDAIGKLPKDTPGHIRRAVEGAANLRPEVKQFAEQLRQYFGIRADDAVHSDVFEEALKDYYTHVWEKEPNMPDDLRAAINNGRVNTYFQFARQRKIPTILDGIMAGKVPKLDPADIVPYYNYLLDRSIASRQFIADASKLTASDGRPALLPTGTAVPVGRGATAEALVINPKGKQALGMDYRTVDHPALKKWKWAGTDETGNPILYRSDLAVHPEYYERIARMMDRGRLTPTNWGRRALRVSSEVKALKFGLASTFHQMHLGAHALFHWTLPFKTEPLDPSSPGFRFAVEKGHLKLASDPRELNLASEGILGGSNLIQKIPAIGPLSKAYSEWLFQDYIPKLKYKTFQNAYARNIWARDNLPGAVTGLKGLSNDQVAARIGDSVNNAYGELNQLFLGKNGRDPRFQRILRGAFLAPDFGEARLRFVEKAMTKTGNEERLALATMFTTLYVGARVANYLSHGNAESDDIKNAFRVKVGNEWVSMRSVLGDVLHAYEGVGPFMYARLNPLYARTAADWLYGRDPSTRRKLTFSQKAVTRPLEQLIPISLQGLTRDDQKLWEGFTSAMGVQVQADRPQGDVRDLVRKWAENNDDPRIKAAAEQHEQSVYPPSAYNPLRNALRDGNGDKARENYDKLLETKTRMEIGRALDPNRNPFAGSRSNERKFVASLSDEDRKIYEAAMAERKQIWQNYLQMMHQP